ncbi:MAG: hypothetical protein KDA90_23615 [Planctomycetaceae bacterium]|nr:hypothetical protein [Planctomycetaceae bacterium]
MSLDLDTRESAILCEDVGPIVPALRQADLKQCRLEYRKGDADRRATLIFSDLSGQGAQLPIHSHGLPDILPSDSPEVANAVYGPTPQSIVVIDSDSASDTRYEKRYRLRCLDTCVQGIRWTIEQREIVQIIGASPSRLIPVIQPFNENQLLLVVLSGKGRHVLSVNREFGTMKLGIQLPDDFRAHHVVGSSEFGLIAYPSYDLCADEVFDLRTGRPVGRLNGPPVAVLGPREFLVDLGSYIAREHVSSEKSRIVLNLAVD